jgi:acetoin utilization deacetylase AcuC-like enzyme
MTILFTDPVFARHEVPHGHPERPERMAAIERALTAETFQHLDRRTAGDALYEAIAAVHPSAHIDRLLAAMPGEGMISLDPDTHAGPTTWAAVLRATGGALAATDAVLAGEDRTAFVAGRPPGHHAEKTRAMGFCFVNHAAVAARHAQRTHGLGRVAIVDFDVHHGNGTQDIFWDDPSVFYVSTHQSPLYPGTGDASERGAGNILNVPLPGGTTGHTYRMLFDAAVMPALNAFAPELVILSAGFDAHVDDPLGGLRLTEDDFVWITERMLDLAARSADGRVVSLLEGGYDLPALGRSVAAHVAALARA